MIVSEVLLQNLINNFVTYFFIGLIIGYLYIFFYASLPGAVLRRLLRQISPMNPNKKAHFIRPFYTAKSRADQ